MKNALDRIFMEEVFSRHVTDVTIWENIYIISWRDD